MRGLPASGAAGDLRGLPAELAGDQRVRGVRAGAGCLAWAGVSFVGFYRNDATARRMRNAG